MPVVENVVYRIAMDALERSEEIPRGDACMLTAPDGAGALVIGSHVRMDAAMQLVRDHYQRKGIFSAPELVDG